MSKKTRIVFIVNPIAGRRKHKNLEQRVCDRLNSFWEPIFVYTEYGGHASEVVLEYVEKGIKHFVAVGGDGTVSEVATSVFKSKAILGIIPSGSGNGLARSLKIPIRLDKAIECLNTNNTCTIDVGKINEGFFFCTCGVGFDAKVGRKFAKQKTRGFSSYVRTTLKEFSKYKAKKYKIKIDNEKTVNRAFLVTIANAGQYGNNAYIAPSAKMDDGLLDICIFKPFPLIEGPVLGARLFTGNIHKSKYLDIYQGKSIVFKKKTKKYSFHIDGDPIKIAGPIKISIIPKALNVIAP